MTLSPQKPSEPASWTIEGNVLTQKIPPRGAQTSQPVTGSGSSCAAKTKTGGNCGSHSRGHPSSILPVAPDFLRKREIGFCEVAKDTISQCAACLMRGVLVWRRG